MLNFIRRFFCIYWDVHMIVILQFVDVVYQIDWFSNTVKSLHPWNKILLIMVYDPLNVLLDLFCSILLKFLHLCSWVIFTCKFSFFFIIIAHLQSSQGQSNDSHRATHNDGEILGVPLMFSFLLWVIFDSGENSPCCLFCLIKIRKVVLCNCFS